MLSDSLQEQLKSLLSRHVAFAFLPEEELAKWPSFFERLSFTTGESICLEGEIGDSAYVISQGQVRVIKQNRQGRGASIGLFQCGDVFGGHWQSEDWLRSATCRAAEDVAVFRISREVFIKLLQDNPALQPFFDRSLPLAALLRSFGLSNLLAGLPDQFLPLVFASLEEKLYPAGHIIVLEGDEGDCLFAIRNGTVQVHKMLPEGPGLLTELGPGGFFGERAILLGEPRYATVTAFTNTVCYVLGRDTFRQLTRQAPQWKMYLARRLHHYLRREEQVRQATEVFLFPLSSTFALFGGHS